MQPWWRPEPLTDWEEQLLVHLMYAHYRSTFRQNPSALAVQLAAQGSGNYLQSLAAGLMTLGGLHGPLVETYDFIAGPDPASVARARLATGQRVMGWGNSFAKGKLDPVLEPVDEHLRGHAIYAKVAGVQLVMDERALYPNPSCYTAATAIALRLPRLCMPWLVVKARLDAWATLFNQSARSL